MVLAQTFAPTPNCYTAPLNRLQHYTHIESLVDYNGSLQPNFVLTTFWVTFALEKYSFF